MFPAFTCFKISSLPVFTTTFLSYDLFYFPFLFLHISLFLFTSSVPPAYLFLHSHIYNQLFSHIFFILVFILKLNSYYKAWSLKKKKLKKIKAYRKPNTVNKDSYS